METRLRINHPQLPLQHPELIVDPSTSPGGIMTSKTARSSCHTYNPAAVNISRIAHTNWRGSDNEPGYGGDGEVIRVDLSPVLS